MRKTCKPLKITVSALLTVLLLCTAFAAGLYGHNRHQLKKEAALIRHQGQYVEIGGRNMNIYTAGSGGKTLVFMAGANTPAVIYEFRPLTDRLKDTYKTAVIEKFGYGYSDDAEGERNLSTLLEQDREALQKAGIPAPYVLCPHSASGLEAVRWAQLYPDEVEAIIGLDMAVPGQFDIQIGDLQHAETQTSGQALRENEFLNFWLYDMGGYRLYNFENVFPAVTGPDLTEAERAEYKAITYHWYSRFYQTAMFREGIMTEAQHSDFLAVHDSPVPDVPTLQILSSDDTTFSMMLGENGLQTWRQLHESYCAALTESRLMQLDCGHYVHAEAPDAVSTEIRKFLDEIQ
ncbi:MAG: alpha/beta hydrolase [Oscillospiraceae bacterium]|nr:alpha/beta hydrolase [Oscillospiraceae bacterium]